MSKNLEPGKIVNLMGQIVTVTAEYMRKGKYSGHNKRKRWWSEVEVTPRAGWVTGYRWLKEGEVYHDYDYGPTFQAKKQIPCLLVVYWPTMNPVRVPLNAYELGGDPSPAGGYEWKESWKEDQRQVARAWPRDDRGRFKPYADFTEAERKEYRETLYGTPEASTA